VIADFVANIIAVMVCNLVPQQAAIRFWYVDLAQGCALRAAEAPEN